jgi:hypothetical protein
MLAVLPSHSVSSSIPVCVAIVDCRRLLPSVIVAQGPGFGDAPVPAPLDDVNDEIPRAGLSLLPPEVSNSTATDAEAVPDIFLWA